MSATDLTKLEAELVADVAAAADLAGLDAVRVAALGKKGRVSELMSKLGSLPAEERKAFGAAVNAVKQKVSEALDARKSVLEAAALEARLATERADITLPVRLGPQGEGRIHPVSQVMDELIEIFADLGFAVAEGPDIETDENNFDKLNIPADHPARQDHDTFYFSPKANGERMLLRTHTSPVQIRTMLKQKPPIRIIAPGRVYRCDSDQTHTPMFHQIEALVIDEATHMGHLKWTLEEMMQGVLRGGRSEDALPRRRTSPSPNHRWKSTSARKPSASPASGWRSAAAAWCIPNVLRNCGLDPEKYQGFAFGMGIDRMAMLKYGIPDLRAFFSGDLRWLKHYGFSMLDMPTLGGGLSS